MTPLLVRKSSTPPAMSPRAATIAELAAAVAHGPDALGVWVVAQVMPRHEKAVAWELHDAEVGYCLPLERVTDRQGEVVDRPVIPGYVFCCVPDVPQLRWDLRQRCRSFQQLIPVPAQGRLVAELTSLHRAAADGLTVAQRRLGPGVVARVASGPFEGHVGMIDHVGNRGVMCLHISILGRVVEYEVDVHLLEPHGGN